MVWMLLLGNQYILNKTAWIFVWFSLHSLFTSFISGLHTAVMVTPRSLALVRVRLPMGVMVESLGTAMKGGILDESRDLADIPVTLNIAIGARRAETRTWEVIRGILDTGDCCYTKISKMLATLKPDFAFLNTAEMSTIGTIEAGRMTIIGERTNPTGTRIESPGMDVVSQMVCTVETRHVQTQFSRANSPPMGFLSQPDRTKNPAGFLLRIKCYNQNCF